MSDYVFLLTACINPGFVPVLRSDPEIRRVDYLKSIKCWASNDAVKKIIFCENSGADLSDIEVILQESGKSYELLTFQGQSFDPKKGKGYGEMEIIKHAFQNSQLIHQHSNIIKVTGRYYVSNIGSFIDKLPKADVIADWKHNLTWTDSRVYCATHSFYQKYFLPLHELLDDSTGMSFEAGLSRAIHHAMYEGGVYAMLPLALKFEGYPGSSSFGSNYSFPEGRLNFLKREIFRRIKSAVISR